MSPQCIILYCGSYFDLLHFKRFGKAKHHHQKAIDFVTVQMFFCENFSVQK